MSRLRLLFLAATLCAAHTPALRAQGHYGVTFVPGTEVRIRTVEHPTERVQARVLVHRNDTLRLAMRTAEREYPLSELSALEVRGDPDHGRGVRIGAGVGVGVGLLSGGIDYARGRTVGGEVITFAIIDGLLGAMLGYLFAPRGWQPLPLPR